MLADDLLRDEVLQDVPRAVPGEPACHEGAAIVVSTLRQGARELDSPWVGKVGSEGTLANGDAAAGAAGAAGVAEAGDPAATIVAKLGFFLKFSICILMSSIWSRAAFATSRAAVAMAFVSLVSVSFFASSFSILLFKCLRPFLAPASMVSGFSFCRSNFSLNVAMRVPSIDSILSSIFLLTSSEMSWARASSA